MNLRSNSKRDASFRLASFFCATFVFFAFFVLFPNNSANAQALGESAQEGMRYLHRPSLPTGELAFFYRTGGKPVDRWQPVAWRTPENVRVGIAAEGEYVFDNETNAFALIPGTVYRFQITDIPYNPGLVLYPTLELVGRLNPPAGQEWNFPIEIEIEQSDLDYALKGNLVTRVIFVENSENAANVDTSDESNGKILVDVQAAIDPIAAAETRGRVVAILRMGSRAAIDLPNAQNPFYFGLPPFALKPREVLETPQTLVSNESAQIADSAETPQATDFVESAQTSDSAETPQTVELIEPSVDAKEAETDASNSDDAE